jgi:hypothetical protein
MISVLAIGVEVCFFKPGQGDGFLRAIGICSIYSFGGEVKPEDPCCKILQHVRELCKYKRNILETEAIISCAQILPI